MAKGKDKIIKVKVTQQEISEGRQGDHKSCPIGLALQNAGFEAVSVDDEIEFEYKGTPYKISIPSKMEKFISNFDNNAEENDEGETVHTVKPFTFEVCVPAPVRATIKM